MQHGMDLLKDKGHARQQLVQAGYHNRSLCLYAKLGFIASEMLSNMTGDAIKAVIPNRTVRPANEGDATTCNELSRNVHGFDRPDELAAAITQGTAKVVDRVSEKLRGQHIGGKISWETGREN